MDDAQQVSVGVSSGMRVVECVCHSSSDVHEDRPWHGSACQKGGEARPVDILGRHEAIAILDSDIEHLCDVCMRKERGSLRLGDHRFVRCALEIRRALDSPEHDFFFKPFDPDRLRLVGLRRPSAPEWAEDSISSEAEVRCRHRLSLR